jgi:soluble lytic murein transglycosylase
MRLKTKIVWLAAISALSLATSTLYKSHSSKREEITIEPVNNETRTSHVRELLGSSIKQYKALRVQNGMELSRYILRQVRERLPTEYKNMAPGVAQILVRESEKNHLDPIFVMALIETESKFNPLARGTHGEIGLMQIKPSTAQWLVQKYKIKMNGEKSLYNPIQNIRIGVAYIRFLRESFKSSATQYVNAYNVGPQKLRRLYASEIKPTEYSTRVFLNYRKIYNEI